MIAEDIKHTLYWTGHILRNSPALAWPAARVALPRYTYAKPDRTKLLIGTHHKVLTVFLGRVFRAFARITNRSYDRGMGAEVDYACDVLIDHHSKFTFDRLRTSWAGLHVVRDPRDLLVSATKYHVRSTEAWLHVPDQKFGGKTYQQMVLAMDSLEERMLFELDNVTGADIAEMLAWTYDRPGMVELRYERMVGDGSARYFSDSIGAWNLPAAEHRLLVGLFEYFSIGKPGTRGNSHIRNARAGQWQDQFTPAVTARFNALFPGAAERLGYPAATMAAA